MQKQNLREELQGEAEVYDGRAQLDLLGDSDDLSSVVGMSYRPEWIREDGDDDEPLDLPFE